MDLRRRKIDILGVEVDDVSEKEAVSAILSMARSKSRRHLVVTVNSEFVMLARRDPNFAKILKTADLAVADGVGVVLAKLILGGKVRERLAGVDLLEKLCSQCAQRAITVGFLGGFGDIAERVKKRQIERNPGLRVVFAGPGDWAIGHDLSLRRAISAVGRVDILFVAYGMGRQEFWIKRNKNFLDVGVFMGVGGAFDYVSMVKKRVPESMKKAGLEWFWRLMMEPHRFWRMRVLPAFLVLIFGQFLKNRIFNL